jgi:hypothetical protein
VSPGSEKEAGAKPPKKNGEDDDGEDDDGEDDDGEDDDGEDDDDEKPSPKKKEGAVPQEPETDDRMDDPPFYRQDVQDYYDGQISMDKDQASAITATKRQFKLRTLIVTPTGEVRSPGVVDDPNPPETPPEQQPDQGNEEPPDEEPEDDSPGSQIGREDPHGKDAGRGAEEADAKWLVYLEREDGEVELFEGWAVRQGVSTETLTFWEAPDLEEHWRPAHMPKRKLAVESEVPRERLALHEKFKRLVNMTTGELRAHLRSHELREMVATSRRSKRERLLEGRRAARDVLRMKALPMMEWSDDLWERCKSVVTFIERTRRNGAPLLDEGGRGTRKLFTLRTYGHNPTVRAAVSEDELWPLLENRRALHRYIDATPGIGLPLLVERERVPDFDVLKRGKVELELEEREWVLDQGAVWHNLPGNPETPTPAVWKSQVGNRTWYVTNTHRLYNAAPTLKGAVGRYHRVVKQTA